MQLLYLDFKKVFDSVPHAGLLKKVHAYSFRGDLFNWIQDFLIERQQRVPVNSSLSNWSEAISGSCIKFSCWKCYSTQAYFSW